MVRLHFPEADLLYDELAIPPGAQTERRGGAGPVRACLAARTPKELSPTTIFMSERLRLE
jgi:hypothetical protein